MKWFLLVLAVFGVESGFATEDSDEALLQTRDLVVYRAQRSKRSRHFYRSWSVLRTYPASGQIDMREVTYDAEKNIRAQQEWRTEPELFLQEGLSALAECECWEVLPFLDTQSVEACRVENVRTQETDVGAQVQISEVKWYSKSVPFLLVRSEKRVEGRLVEVIDVSHVVYGGGQ